MFAGIKIGTKITNYSGLSTFFLNPKFCQQKLS